MPPQKQCLLVLQLSNRLKYWLQFAAGFSCAWWNGDSFLFLSLISIESEVRIWPSIKGRIEHLLYSQEFRDVEGIWETAMKYIYILFLSMALHCELLFYVWVCWISGKDNDFKNVIINSHDYKRFLSLKCHDQFHEIFQVALNA